jgi:hypothetical protein
MTWYELYLPRAVRASPTKEGERKYSRDQTLIALLSWFATQPLEERLVCVLRHRKGRVERETAELPTEHGD